MTKFKNRYGASGAGPFAGYKSLNAWRTARREERLKDVAERVANLEEMEKRDDDHFKKWIAERCFLQPGEVVIEDSTLNLRSSYSAWCKSAGIREHSKQKWGRWMAAHYIRVVRNSCGVGRVYIGIAARGG